MKQYKWKITFLIQNVSSSPTSDDFFEKLINELISLNFDDPIIIYLVITLNNNSQLISANMEMPEKISDKLFSITIRLVPGAGKPNKFRKINSYETLNLGFKEDLKTLLKDTAPQKAHKEMIITYDHGAGLCFFPRFENLVKLVSSNLRLPQFIEDKKPMYVQNEFKLMEFKGIDKEPTYTLMSVDDFKAAFENYSTKKIDVLVMMNCWMLMLDNCVTLSSVFKNIVSSSSTIGFNGYNYQEILDSIKRDKNIADIVNSVVESSKHIEGTGRVAEQNAIFGISTKYYSFISFLFNFLLINMSFNLKNKKQKIINDRKASVPWVFWGFDTEKSPFELMDLIFCIDVLMANGSKIVKGLGRLIKFLVKKSLYTNTNVGIRAGAKDTNLRGPSVLFPLNSNDYKEDRLIIAYYSVKKTSFSKISIWPGFLNHLFK